ncbi:MAG: sigma-54-dependent Fis family transcriptional regulator [Kiritimatiellae bacterium]|nr:sigma-54-dependent Fis family transcriptional regulator [Kiritimatiellia bacterium]
MKPSILIVDDEKNTRDGLERALRREYRVRTAESGDSALELMAQDPPDILLTDLRMPGMDGLTLVQRALGRYPDLVCLLLTAYGSVETAVEAMKRGAYDYLTKPVNLDELELVLKRALRSQMVESENANLHEQLDDKYGMESIIGNSPAMAQLFDTIRQAAPTQATVLVQGESGTGKELVAHAVHRLSNRARGPFVAVHCAALSMNLLESELFGHEKGAFTGAVSRRKGRFELADGGTLFLDEISEIDASIQVKLLRVLEERTFERVGGDETIETDIRLITATNKDLKTLVKEGKFREDLFFRLDVVNITLPPLRERVGDVPMLCSHFLQEFSESNNREISGFTPDAVTILSNYNWPGNVRELRNTIEKMVVLSRGDRLSARDIPANIREAVKASGPAVVLPSGDTMHGGDSLAATEQRMIMATLKKLNGNRTKAAEELGISRRTLHRKLKQYEEEAATASFE